MATTLPMEVIRPNASVMIAEANALHALTPLAGVIGRSGTLEARLATSGAEIAAAQEVRFRVFFEELGAKRGQLDAQDHRDADRFDDVCDHLLVFDTAIDGPAHRQIVGTYRLLRQERAGLAGGFYSADEFEIDSLTARHPGLNFLELGRSCVLPEYRHKRTVEVLWQGIWAYCNHHKIDVMAGCASFAGTIPAAHAEQLSLLHHHFRAQGEWAAKARPSRFAAMDLMPAEAVNAKAAMTALPTLIKGYLRLGAMFGEGCVIDHDFATTDVFVVLPVQQIAGRYIQYYGGKQ